MRPLLLLDVDGVLCPLGHRDREPMLEADLGTYGLVRYAEATPDRLARLGQLFDLVWATSWEDDANDVLSPLFGLPTLRVVRFGGVSLGRGAYQSWKLRPIRQFVGDRPFAWIDDDIGRDAHQWATRRAIPTLLLDIRPDCGLDADHVEQLLEFAERASR